MPNYSDVDGYIAAQDLKQQALLQQVRQLIGQAAPKALEGIQWNLPTYELGGMLCSLAARKGFITLYFAPDFPQEKVESLGLDCGKSCIRFKNNAPLPTQELLNLLEQAAQFNQNKS